VNANLTYFDKEMRSGCMFALFSLGMCWESIVDTCLGYVD
jgi:hypothetical protein